MTFEDLDSLCSQPDDNDNYPTTPTINYYSYLHDDEYPCSHESECHCFDEPGEEC